MAASTWSLLFGKPLPILCGLSVALGLYPWRWVVQRVGPGPGGLWTSTACAQGPELGSGTLHPSPARTPPDAARRAWWHRALGPQARREQGRGTARQPLQPLNCPVAPPQVPGAGDPSGHGKGGDRSWEWTRVIR